MIRSLDAFAPITGLDHLVFTSHWVLQEPLPSNIDTVMLTESIYFQEIAVIALVDIFVM